MTRDFSNIMAQRLAEDTYLSIIWPVLSSCRLKFKICPEPWPTFFHSPRSSWPWAVTPVMLYKCHESRDWQLPYKRRDFGLRALSQSGPFVQRRRQNEQWCFTDKVSKNKTPRQGKFFYSQTPLQSASAEHVLISQAVYVSLSNAWQEQSSLCCSVVRFIYYNTVSRFIAYPLWPFIL